MTTEAPPTSAAEKPQPVAEKPHKKKKKPAAKKQDKPRLVVSVIILAVIVIAYVLSLVGVHYLQRSRDPCPRWT